MRDRPVVRLPEPVLAFTLLDIESDGTSGEWDAEVVRVQEAGPAAAGTPAGRPVAVLAGSGRHMPADASLPSPFRDGGVSGRWRWSGRLFDRWRDRLGYRLRAPALVALWGRGFVGVDKLRAQAGRVLAIGYLAGESPVRMQRLETGARRLGAVLVELSYEQSEREMERALLYAAPGAGARIDAGEVTRLIRDRSVRRWKRRPDRGTSNGAEAVGYLCMIPAVVAGVLAHLIGLPEGASIGVGIVVLALMVVTVGRHVLVDRSTETEVLIAGPDGEDVGIPITVERRTWRQSLNWGAARGAID
jgi:hypothetical protein